MMHDIQWQVLHLLLFCCSGARHVEADSLTRKQPLRAYSYLQWPFSAFSVSYAAQCREGLDFTVNPLIRAQGP